MKNNPVEEETRRRIKLAVWSAAYELFNDSLVPDAVFDEEARKVDLSVKTNRPDLDKWFSENFSPDTGMWIHAHPELDRIVELYKKYYRSI